MTEPPDIRPGLALRGENGGPPGGDGGLTLTPTPPPSPAAEPTTSAGSSRPELRRRGHRRPGLLVAAGAWLLAVALATASLALALGRGGGGGPSPQSTVVAISTEKVAISGEGTVASVAKSLGPAVGTIVATTVTGLGTSTSGLGSGFVIANGGGLSYLLTNNHVVAGSSSLRAVLSSGRSYTATLVGTDSIDDLAVVSVEDGHLPQAVFGTSADLVTGQDVVAIGSPLGNQNSVTVGVVSALHRSITAGSGNGSVTENLSDVLQTDAPISPGNSGGPLADMAGRVVGVNVATSQNGNNVSFSIPSDRARVVAEDLMQHRAVEHPFLGIGFLTPLDAAEQGRPFSGPGILVTQVVSGSAAAAAGLQPGDVVTAVDDVPLDATQTLGGLIARHHVGDVLAFAVERGGRTLTLSATLAQRPAA